jgi:protein subunit release factor A
VAKELLFSLTKKDFRVDTFRSGGKGGQHQNTCESGVRITHIDSVATGECREERSQHQNKCTAFKRLSKSNTFLAWVKMKSSEIMTQETIEEIVTRELNDSNLKIEVVQNGKFIDEKEIVL